MQCNFLPISSIIYSMYECSSVGLFLTSSVSQPGKSYYVYKLISHSLTLRAQRQQAVQVNEEYHQ
jgi:hypothetical protein